MTKVLLVSINISPASWLPLEFRASPVPPMSFLI